MKLLLALAIPAGLVTAAVILAALRASAEAERQERLYRARRDLYEAAGLDPDEMEVLWDASGEKCSLTCKTGCST